MIHGACLGYFSREYLYPARASALRFFAVTLRLKKGWSLSGSIFLG
jgi:hypothetical protein